MSENSGNWKHCTKRKKDKREDSRMENALLELKEKMKLESPKEENIIKNK